MGQRLGFTVQTLVERYAELGQIVVSRIGTEISGSRGLVRSLCEKRLMPSVEERERLADLRAQEVGDTVPRFRRGSSSRRAVCGSWRTPNR